MISQTIELRVGCEHKAKCPVLRAGRCAQLNPVNLGSFDVTNYYDAIKLRETLLENGTPSRCESTERGAKKGLNLSKAIPTFALAALHAHQKMKSETLGSFSVPTDIRTY